MRDFFIHFFLPSLFLCFFQTVVTIADKNHLTFVSILYNESGVFFHTKKIITLLLTDTVIYFGRNVYAQ